MAHIPQHAAHAFSDYYPLEREGLTVVSRRNMLKVGMAGIAGTEPAGLVASSS